MRLQGQKKLVPPLPERDARALAEVHKLADELTKPRDPLNWARRILVRHSEGTYTLPIGIANAREALGIAGDPPPEAA
jgi:hypothetical protein